VHVLLVLQKRAVQRRDEAAGIVRAMRFAPDGELPGLVQRALNEKLSCDAIKKSIQNWRADDFRV